MQIGCGFRIKPVKGREYVYFWHYEQRTGRSRQAYDYMGPRQSAATARRLSDAIDAYYLRASEALRRHHAEHRLAVGSLRM